MAYQAEQTMKKRNLSQIEKWANENKQAIKAYNNFVEDNGFFADEHNNPSCKDRQAFNSLQAELQLAFAAQDHEFEPLSAIDIIKRAPKG